MIDELRDITLELTDIGYVINTDYSTGSDNRGDDVKITIYGKQEFDDEFGLDVKYIYPDEVCDALDRILTFLSQWGYTPEETSKLTIDVIKSTPNELSKDEILIPVGKFYQLHLKWDDIFEKYKIFQSITLDFKQI